MLRAIRFRGVAVIVLAAACSALAAPAPESGAPDIRSRVGAIFGDLDRIDSPGCALGVYQDGKIVYARGYGMANLELGVANSPQTVFDIGSTSKQFTAFSIHLLARDGKLSLDDDVRKYVPEVPNHGKTITIRHLLHHTSGLRDYLELMSLQGVQDEDLSTEEDSLAIIPRQKALNFQPGDEYLYSNTGYFLLSVIVKRASGKSLRDFAAERIFTPLDMRHTQFNDSHTRIIPNRATGYSKAKGGGFGIDMSDYEQTGDGSLLTTIEDLFRWDQNFYEPKVGDRALMEAMLTPGSLNSGKKLEYASALMAGSYRGLATVSHGGAWVGYRAQLMRFPQQKLSVACLCNLGDSNPSALAKKVAEVYLGHLMKSEASLEAKKAKKTRFSPSRKELERLSGSYRNRATGTVVSVIVKEGKLIARMEGVPYALMPTARDRFRIDGDPSREVEFLSASGGRGRPKMRVTEEDEAPELFEPVELWKPVPKELALLAGSYASEELATTWRLVAEDAKLVVRHRGISADPLTPTVADTFTLDDMNLTFTRDAANRVTGFRLDWGRVRGITFTKQPAG